MCTTVSDHELFASQTNVFSGFQKPFEKAGYIILGVPFDMTSTYRTGARFGPNAIRQASLNMETYSIRTGIDIEDLAIHDLGDLHVSTDTEKTLQTLECVIRSILEHHKTPVTLGGEHTITLGIARAFKEKAEKTAIVTFDAHLDLRDEFLNQKLSHTTFMRRLNEQVKPAKIIEVGTRAVCKEELAYAKKTDIQIITTQQIKKQGTQQTNKQLRKLLEPYKNVYLTVDMDILDPAYVPAAQNPEPEGLETTQLLDLLEATCDNRVNAFDVLEIAPNYDQGISALQTTKIINELLCLKQKTKHSQKPRKQKQER